MKNNETGEYELVVGNPQLLSGFVIVVLLCAVAFVMGYVVGQNTPHSAKTEQEAAPPPPAALRARPPASPVRRRPPAPPSDADPAQTADDAAERRRTASAAHHATRARIAGRARAAAPAPAPPGPAAPPACRRVSYWQVMAVRQADAQVVAANPERRRHARLLRPAPRI